MRWLDTHETGKGFRCHPDQRRPVSTRSVELLKMRLPCRLNCVRPLVVKMKLRLLIALGLGTGLLAALNAQTLEITPARVMVDETATLRVTGLEPQKRITINASLTDGAEEPWTSTADFVADETGVVDVSRQVPVKGSYRSVSAMGLIWSMMPAAKHVSVYRAPHGFATQAISFAVMADGKQIASGQMEQLGIGEGVQQIRLKGALHGVFFIPATPGQHSGVLVVGGSEGGAQWRRRRGWLRMVMLRSHWHTFTTKSCRQTCRIFRWNISARRSAG